MRLFGASLNPALIVRADIRRLGAEEAKRREGLRVAEQQAQTEHKGVWAEEPENVSGLMLDACNEFDKSNEPSRFRCLPIPMLSSTSIRARTSMVSHAMQDHTDLSDRRASPRRNSDARSTPTGRPHASVHQPCAWRREHRMDTHNRSLLEPSHHEHLPVERIPIRPSRLARR